MRTLEIFSGSGLIVSAISESDLAAYLNDQERNALEKLRSEKRRIEWASSRIAARVIAIRRGFVSEPLELSFGREAERPFATTPDGRRFFVSFSHTLSSGAAVLDAAPVGVDIERVRVIDRRAWKFFLTPEEIREVELSDDPLVPLHWWCAKEAAFKMIGLTTLKTIPLRADRFESGGRVFSGEGFSVRTTIRDDFCTALARSSDSL